MRIFRAEPTRTASFLPGRRQIMLMTSGKTRRAELHEFLYSNSVEKLPVEQLTANVRFMETMRAKGWLK